MSVFAEALQVN